MSIEKAYNIWAERNNFVQHTLYEVIRMKIMGKTAIFYSFHTNKTSKVSEKIIEAFGKDSLDVINAEEVTDENFLKYDNYIIGVATWWDGELPNYWDRNNFVQHTLYEVIRT